MLSIGLDIISSLILYYLIIRLILTQKDLKKENNRLREIIKSEIEYVIANKEYKASCEDFQETCEDFIKKV